MSLVIGTYASLAYVHLQLEAWRRHCADMPCLVRDDCSHERDRLSGLCRDYGADFESNTRRRGHVVGDMLVFTRGLAWAASVGTNLLVKFSRRWIPLMPWQDALGRLASESQSPTLCARCTHHGFGFRSECVAMHVPTWIATEAMQPLCREIQAASLVDASLSPAESGILVEAVVHNSARRAYKARPRACDEYEIAHPRPHGCDSYAEWPMMGSDRVSRREGVLWHEWSRPEEYHRALVEWGIRDYSLADLADVNTDRHA